MFRGKRGAGGGSVEGQNRFVYFLFFSLLLTFDSKILKFLVVFVPFCGFAVGRGGCGGADKGSTMLGLVGCRCGGGTPCRTGFYLRNRPPPLSRRRCATPPFFSPKKCRWLLGALLSLSLSRPPPSQKENAQGTQRPHRCVFSLAAFDRQYRGRTHGGRRSKPRARAKAVVNARTLTSTRSCTRTFLKTKRGEKMQTARAPAAPRRALAFDTSSKISDDDGTAGPWEKKKKKGERNEYGIYCRGKVGKEGRNANTSNRAPRITSCGNGNKRANKAREARDG